MPRETTMGLLFDDMPLVGADIFSFPRGGLSAGVTGQVGASGGGRHLDIVGTMDLGGFGSVATTTAGLRDAIIGRMRNSGWSVGNVQLSWSGGKYQIRMSVWVRNEFSNQQVLDNAARGLSNFRLGLYGWGPAAFSNIRLRLETPNAKAGASTNFPPVNYGGDGRINSGSFLDSFGSGLGISTPIVIGAGALILVLILRK